MRWNMHRAMICAAVAVAAGTGCAKSSTTAPGDTSNKQPADTSTLRVVVASSGVNVPTTYSVRIDSGPAHAVGANAATLISGIRLGAHVLTLVGAEDCTIWFKNSVAYVQAIDTATVAFNVTCWESGLGNKRLAYTVYSAAGSNIYARNVNGTGVVQLTTDGVSNQPAWSPDGRRIAFSSRRGGTGGDIYVMDADGSNVVRRTFTASANRNGGPAWSPDGRKIAFTHWEGVGGSGVVTVVSADDDGTSAIALTKGCMPSWSPDGGRIAFSAPNCNDYVPDNLFVMSVDGSNVVQLTRDTAALNWDAAWSPDGRKIAFEVCLAGCSVALIEPDGSGLTLVAPGAEPRWSASSSVIAFMSSGSIRAIALTGGYSGVVVPEGADPAWRP
jgi:hypothetical protein